MKIKIVDIIYYIIFILVVLSFIYVGVLKSNINTRNHTIKNNNIEQINIVGEPNEKCLCCGCY